MWRHLPLLGFLYDLLHNQFLLRLCLWIVPADCRFVRECLGWDAHFPDFVLLAEAWDPLYDLVRCLVSLGDAVVVDILVLDSVEFVVSCDIRFGLLLRGL